LSLAVAKAEVAAVGDDGEAIARIKAAAEALLGQGVGGCGPVAIALLQILVRRSSGDLG